MLSQALQINKSVSISAYLSNEEVINSRIKGEATAVCVPSDDIAKCVSDELTHHLTSSTAFVTGPFHETFDLVLTSQSSLMGQWLRQSMSGPVSAAFDATESRGQPLFILAACRKVVNPPPVVPVVVTNNNTTTPLTATTSKTDSLQHKEQLRKRKMALLLQIDDDDDE